MDGRATPEMALPPSADPNEWWSVAASPATRTGGKSAVREAVRRAVQEVEAGDVPWAWQRRASGQEFSDANPIFFGASPGPASADATLDGSSGNAPSAATGGASAGGSGGHGFSLSDNAPLQIALAVGSVVLFATLAWGLAWLVRFSCRRRRQRRHDGVPARNLSWSPSKVSASPFEEEGWDEKAHLSARQWAATDGLSPLPPLRDSKMREEPGRSLPHSHWNGRQSSHENQLANVGHVAPMPPPRAYQEPRQMGVEGRNWDVYGCPAATSTGRGPAASTSLAPILEGKTPSNDRSNAGAAASTAVEHSAAVRGGNYEVARALARADVDIPDVAEMDTVIGLPPGVPPARRPSFIERLAKHRAASLSLPSDAGALVDDEDTPNDQSHGLNPSAPTSPLRKQSQVFRDRSEPVPSGRPDNDHDHRTNSTRTASSGSLLLRKAPATAKAALYYAFGLATPSRRKTDDGGKTTAAQLDSDFEGTIGARDDELPLAARTAARFDVEASTLGQQSPMSPPPPIRGAGHVQTTQDGVLSPSTPGMAGMGRPWTRLRPVITSDPSGDAGQPRSRQDHQGAPTSTTPSLAELQRQDLLARAQRREQRRRRAQGPEADVEDVAGAGTGEAAAPGRRNTLDSVIGRWRQGAQVADPVSTSRQGSVAEVAASIVGGQAPVSPNDVVAGQRGGSRHAANTVSSATTAPTSSSSWAESRGSCGDGKSQAGNSDPVLMSSPTSMTSVSAFERERLVGVGSNEKSTSNSYYPEAGTGLGVEDAYRLDLAVPSPRTPCANSTVHDDSRRASSAVSAARVAEAVELKTTAAAGSDVMSLLEKYADTPQLERGRGAGAAATKRLSLSPFAAEEGSEIGFASPALVAAAEPRDPDNLLVVPLAPPKALEGARFVRRHGERTSYVDELRAMGAAAASGTTAAVQSGEELANHSIPMASQTTSQSSGSGKVAGAPIEEQQQQQQQRRRSANGAPRRESKATGQPTAVWGRAEEAQEEYKREVDRRQCTLLKERRREERRTARELMEEQQRQDRQQQQRRQDERRRGRRSEGAGAGQRRAPSSRHVSVERRDDREAGVPLNTAQRVERRRERRSQAEQQQEAHRRRDESTAPRANHETAKSEAVKPEPRRAPRRSEGHLVVPTTSSTSSRSIKARKSNPVERRHGGGAEDANDVSGDDTRGQRRAVKPPLRPRPPAPRRRDIVVLPPSPPDSPWTSASEAQPGVSARIVQGAHAVGGALPPNRRAPGSFIVERRRTSDRRRCSVPTVTVQAAAVVGASSHPCGPTAPSRAGVGAAARGAPSAWDVPSRRPTKHAHAHADDYERARAVSVVVGAKAAAARAGANSMVRQRSTSLQHRVASRA